MPADMTVNRLFWPWLLADLPQSTCCRQGQYQCGKVPFQGEYSESSTHVQAVLPTVRLGKSARLYMTVKSFFWPWITVKNTNRPHGSGEEQDSKLGNSLTLAFLVPKRVIRHDLIQLEVVRMTMYEENGMYLC